MLSDTLCACKRISYTQRCRISIKQRKMATDQAWRETSSKKSEHREERKGEIREESWEKRETEASV